MLSVSCVRTCATWPGKRTHQGTSSHQKMNERQQLYVPVAVASQETTPQRQEQSTTERVTAATQSGSPPAQEAAQRASKDAGSRGWHEKKGNKKKFSRGILASTDAFAPEKD